ncbi:MAG: helix-turn-helix transcriptional regulator [Chloroflexota bacterium]
MALKSAIERFVWFDSMVRAKRHPNATTLAKHFEISAKTAQRDIDYMRDRLGCPLLYDKADKGYYYGSDTFRLPMVYLSSDELTSLLMARKFLMDISGGYVGKEVTDVIKRLTGILKQNLSAEARIDGAVSFQLVEYAPVPESTVKTVIEGCLKKTCLTFDYHSPLYDSATTRTADPYHVLNYRGTWHLIAWCHKRKAIRDFQLSRMSNLTMEECSFEIPPDFDVERYLNASFGIYKGEPSETVTLLFSPEKARWVKGQIWHKDQKENVLEDGSLELTFPVASHWEVMMEVLRHGSGVRVLHPASLGNLVRQEALKIAELYRHG